MNKGELKNLSQYFGTRLPAGKIQNRDVRIAIVRLYASLAVADKAITDEMEEMRKTLVGDKEEELRRWSELNARAEDANLSADDRMKAKTEADAMTECANINRDYIKSVNDMLAEESNAEVRKVSLEVLYEALSDCGFPTFDENMPIAAVEQIFAHVIE